MSQNTTTSYALETLNDDMAHRLLPVIIIVGIYMILGLFGNPLVAIYYGLYAKNTPSHHFILSLSILDLVMCCVDMPLEIVDLRHYYNFESVAACKCLRFISYFCSIASGCILLAIATDRYRKICQPFKKQITLKMTKIMIGSACLFSLFVSWPSLVFYTVVRVNVTRVPALEGFDCTLLKDDEYTALVTAYNIFQFVCFIFAITSLTVLYTLIGRKLYQLRSFKFYATQNTARSDKGQHSSSYTSYSDNETPRSTNLHRLSSHMIEIPDEIDDKPLATIKVLSSGSSYYNKSRPTSASSGYKSASFSSRGSKIHPERKENEESSLSEARISRTKSDVTPKRTKSDVTNGVIKGVSISSIEIPERLRYNGSVKYAFSERSIMSKFGSSISKVSHLTEYDDAYFTPENQSETRDANPVGDIDDSGKKLKAQNIRTTKYTVIMLSITITFVLTYLPYLGLITWRTLEEDRLSEIMTKSELVALELFLRSFLISSIANPFIYGFLNTGFRNFVKSVFKKSCWCCPCFKEKVNRFSETDHSYSNEATNKTT
ncbi:uncharacterized protein LOC134689608 [Mytilus trossulus]|uniref:uncharacterized protein LOC134689608 n=1 Tax=Mytilus trossulus TaxID=6551 RepID=UPI0030048033